MRSSSVADRSTGIFDMVPAGRGSGRSSGGPSLPGLMKTVGTLALLLSQDAAANSLHNQQSYRRGLQNVGSEVEYSPYNYGSICEPEMLAKVPPGLTEQECLDLENVAINEERDSRPLAKVRKCTQVAGGITAALAGLGILGCMSGSDDGVSAGGKTFMAAFVPFIPTFVCGVMWGNIARRVEKSRDEAEECCKKLPQLLADENLTESTLAPPATNDTTTPSASADAPQTRR